MPIRPDSVRALQFDDNKGMYLFDTKYMHIQPRFAFLMADEAPRCVGDE